MIFIHCFKFLYALPLPNTIQFNSIQFNLYFHKKYKHTSRNIKILKKQNMEEKTGRPIRPDNFLFLTRKKKLHNIQITTLQNQTRQEDKTKDCSRKNETIHNLI